MPSVRSARCFAQDGRDLPSLVPISDTVGDSRERSSIPVSRLLQMVSRVSQLRLVWKALAQKACVVATKMNGGNLQSAS
ncbi:MAG: hypothetical protein EOM24_01410 [Chloroflexia bacterium]|nr:hypothetical protein [Chloroflexia bacterium]